MKGKGVFFIVDHNPFRGRVGRQDGSQGAPFGDRATPTVNNLK